MKEYWIQAYDSCFEQLCDEEGNEPTEEQVLELMGDDWYTNFARYEE